MLGYLHCLFTAQPILHSHIIWSSPNGVELIHSIGTSTFDTHITYQC